MNLIAFGKNTLNNLLMSDFVSFKRVIVIEEKKNEYKKFFSIFEKKKIPYEILKKDQFFRFVSDKKHQGIIAFLNDYKYSSLQDLVSNSDKENPFFVMLDSIEDPHNFGAIIRTCSAFDVDGIIILDKNQVQVNSTVLKVSTGGLSYVPICRVKSLEQSASFLKSKGFSIISTVCQNELSSSNEQKNYNADIAKCLVFGNEHSGIRNKLIKESDQLVSIPLKNEMNSLNVSVSCGVIISLLKGVFLT